MKNSDILDKYIALLKERFPYYTYVNTLIDECLESTLAASASDYSIIVKGIPKNKFREFSSYVDENILSDLIEKDEPLPCIIMLQKEDAIADISFSLWNNITKTNDPGFANPYVLEFPDVSCLKKNRKQQLRKSNQTINGEYLCAENYDYASAA